MDINIQKNLQDSTNISTVSHVCIGKLSMTLKSVTENRSASKDNERCTLPQSMIDHHIKERFDDDINRFDQVFVSCLDVRNINKKKFQIEKKCVRKNIDVGGKEPEDVDVEESQEQIITTSTANIMCIDGKYSISETQYSDQDIGQQPGSSVATKEEEYSVINQSVIDTRPTTRVDQSETKIKCPHTFESKNADNRKESQITEKYSKTQTFSKTPIDNEIPIVTSVDSNKFQQDYRHTKVEVARVPQTTQEIVNNNKFVKKCVEPTTISEHWHKEYYKAESARRTQHRLDDKLQELRAGLSALREMDLDLLKQLIDISSTIRSIKRADVLKVTRSMSFICPSKQVQRKIQPPERQYSMPHTASFRRDSITGQYSMPHTASLRRDSITGQYSMPHTSSLRRDSFTGQYSMPHTASLRRDSITGENIGDSLSSLEETQMGSHSKLDESLNAVNFICPSPETKSFQNSIMSLEFTENMDQTFEDVLKRNIRFWKMSFKELQSKNAIATL